MHYVVYFAGPLVLGLLGARLLRQRFRIFAVGLVTFLAVWLVMVVAASLATAGLGVRADSLLNAVVVATLAGVCEEPARYFVFRRLAAFRQNHTWPASLTYALGHHGMETIIVGLTLLLTVAVVRYKPDAITDPAMLRQAEATAALGGLAQLAAAGERLLIGLLVHACFSGLVMLAAATVHLRWLLLAVAWHIGHDIIALNVHRLPAPEIMTKAWLVVIVVGYTFLLLRIYHALQRVAPAARPAPASAGPSSMILPGRPA